MKILYDNLTEYVLSRIHTILDSEFHEIQGTVCVNAD